MLCHVALICTIYCMTDMIYAVACKDIKVVRFRGSFYLCLFLNYVKQTTKSNLAKNYYQIRRRDFQENAIFIPPQ